MVLVVLISYGTAANFNKLEETTDEYFDFAKEWNIYLDFFQVEYEDL